MKQPFNNSTYYKYKREYVVLSNAFRFTFSLFHPHFW